MIRSVRYIATFVVFLGVTQLTRAQSSDSSWNVDVGLGAIVSAPSSSFSSVPGIASPGGLRYDAVNGSTMMMATLGADLPVSELFRVGVRASYTSMQHRHAAFEQAPIAVEGGSVITATMRHDLQGTFRMLGVEPYVRYDPSSWLSISAGLPLMSVATSRYTQTLSFVDPPGIRFVDGSIEQVTARGEVPNLRAVIPMISFTAEGMVPASSTGSIVLVPRVSVARSLGSYTGDGAFNAQTVTASIGFRYRFLQRRREPTAPTPATEPIPTPRVPDPISLAVRVERDTFFELMRGITEEATTLASVTVDTVDEGVGDPTRKVVRRRETYRVAVPKPPSVLRASLQLRFFDDAGNVSQNARLSAVRIESRRVISFLPIIAFDGDNAGIPARYHQLTTSESRTWKEAAIDGSMASHLQYEVLNIIGSRMRRVRTSRCTLVGYAVAQRHALVEQRIEAIRAYITARFGVAAERMNVEIRAMSEDERLLTDAIMFTESGRELLNPIEYSSTFIETQLPKLQLVPDVISEAGLRAWSIEALQGEVRVRSFADTGAVPQEIVWDMNDDLDADGAIKQPVVLTLRVTDVDDAQSSSQPVKVSLTSRIPPAAASRPVKRMEIFTLGRLSYSRQSAPDVRKDGTPRRQLAEWTTAGLEPPERRLYEQSGMNLSVQLLERR